MAGPWTPPDFEAEYVQAAKRVGHTVESRARWLLGLVDQLSFDRLSVGEQGAFRWEMSVFKGYKPDPQVGPALTVGEAEARRWHPRLKEGLRRLAKGRAWGHALVTHVSFWIPLVVQWEKVRLGHPDAVHVTRTEKDAVAHIVCTVLLAVQNRLRRCRRSTCGRLFVRRKRQLYCTPSCGALTRVRRHRHRKREERVGPQAAQEVRHPEAPHEDSPAHRAPLRRP